MSINAIDSSISSMMRMPPPPPDPGKMVSDIISAKDTDGDGALTIEETGLSEELFSQIDTDGDGLATQEELLAKIQEKMEEMKGKMGDVATGDSQTSDLDAIKQMMAEMGPPPEEDSETDSVSGTDMYTQILEQLGMSEDEIKSFFDIIANNPTSTEA